MDMHEKICTCLCALLHNLRCISTHDGIGRQPASGSFELSLRLAVPCQVPHQHVLRSMCLMYPQDPHVHFLRHHPLVEGPISGHFHCHMFCIRIYLPLILSIWLNFGFQPLFVYIQNVVCYEFIFCGSCSSC